MASIPGIFMCICFMFYFQRFLYCRMLVLLSISHSGYYTPKTLPKSSNIQGLVPCSISELNSSKQSQSGAPTKRHCVLPLKTAQSPNALLLRNSHKSIQLQKTDETTLPEQALKVPRG